LLHYFWHGAVLTVIEVMSNKKDGLNVTNMAGYRYYRKMTDSETMKEHNR